MDFKNVLEEWKNYQKYKLVMANLFPCTVTADGCTVRGNLTFTGRGDGRLLKCGDSSHGFTWTLLLSLILGTSPEGSTIRFTLVDRKIVICCFPSESMQRAAHAAFLRFEREEYGPTPPSSGESGNSSDD